MAVQPATALDAQASPSDDTLTIYTITLHQDRMTVEVHGQSDAVFASLFSLTSMALIFGILAWIGLGQVVEWTLNGIAAWSWRHRIKRRSMAVGDTS